VYGVIIADSYAGYCEQCAGCSKVCSYEASAKWQVKRSFHGDQTKGVVGACTNPISAALSVGVVQDILALEFCQMGLPDAHESIECVCSTVTTRLLVRR